MEPMSKDEIAANIGIIKFTSPKLAVKAKYLSGVKAFDGGHKAGPVSFAIGERGMEIEMIEGFSKLRTCLTSESIAEITLENRERIAEKKSMLGRAIIGGALLGPLGAAVGAASAKGGSATEADFFLLISNTSSEEPSIFHVETKHAKDVESFFKKHFSDKYSLS